MKLYQICLFAFGAAAALLSLFGESAKLHAQTVVQARYCVANGNKCNSVNNATCGVTGVATSCTLERDEKNCVNCAANQTGRCSETDESCGHVMAHACSAGQTVEWGPPGNGWNIQYDQDGNPVACRKRKNCTGSTQCGTVSQGGGGSHTGN